MMQEEVVRRRQWLSAEEFLDLVGAANLIPGPNSTELAILIGRKRGGFAGLLVAGAAFIAPAAAIVTLVAQAYASYGTLPDVKGALYGMRPVVMAVVLLALVAARRPAVETKTLSLLPGVPLLFSRVI